MRNHTVFITLCVCATLIACASIIANAGPLNPPTGAVSSSYKTLDEVEARRPINDVFTPGNADSRHVISSSGSYYLTGALTVSGMHNAIEVRAPNVTIDLNGYTISSSTLFGQADTGILLPAGVPNAVVNGTLTVRNGIITGFASRGIGVLGTDESLIIRDLVVKENGNGVGAAGDCDARDCGFLRNAGTGLSAGFGSIVRGCRALDNDFTGISILTGSVVDCVVENCDVDGISVGDIDDGVSIVRGNVVNGSGDYGVSGLNAIVEGNAIANSENGGIRTLTITQFSANADGVVARNFLMGNGTLASEAAINITGGHYRVDENTIADSPIGVLVGSGFDTVVTRNTIDNTTTPLSFMSAGNVSGLLDTDYSTDRAWQNVQQ